MAAGIGRSIDATGGRAYCGNIVNPSLASHRTFWDSAMMATVTRVVVGIVY